MTETKTKSTVRVVIVESEAGWGRKIDEIREFPTEAKARAFVTKYNSRNTAATAPSWYMAAYLEKDYIG